MNNSKKLILFIMAFIIGQQINAAAHRAINNPNDNNIYNRFVNINNRTLLGNNIEIPIQATFREYQDLRMADLETLLRVFGRLQATYTAPGAAPHPGLLNVINNILRDHDDIYNQFITIINDTPLTDNIDIPLQARFRQIKNRGNTSINNLLRVFERLETTYTAPGAAPRAGLLATIADILRQLATDQQPHDANDQIYRDLIYIIENTPNIRGIAPHAVPNEDRISTRIRTRFDNVVRGRETDFESLTRIMTELQDTYTRVPAMEQDPLPTIDQLLLEIPNLQLQRLNDPIEIAKDHANLLIEQSYFSPEMQYAVTSYMNNGLFELNVLTGKVSNIPTVADIIAGKLNADGVRDPYGDEVGRKNALHAALEATKIAKFLAGLNAAYAMSDNNITFAPTLNSSWTAPLDQNLIGALNLRENNLKTALGYDNSYYQWITDWSLWIPKSLTSMIYTTPTRTRIAIAEVPQLNFNRFQRNRQANDVVVRIPDNTIKNIIRIKADYKQKIDPEEAANLLFKQCFITQQTFEENNRFNIQLNEWPIYCMPIRPSISTSNYIFDQLEVSPGNYANTIGVLCEKITAAGFCNHTKDQLHILLLQIRKAIQTAMFIANKDSSYNMGYKFPSGVSQYLDKIIGRLSIYDNMLDKLCKNKDFGGGNRDAWRSSTWNTISSIAMGIGVLGAVGVAAFTGYKAVGAAGAGVKNVYHGIFGKTLTPSEEAAADKVAADKALADKVAAELKKGKVNQQKAGSVIPVDPQHPPKNGPRLGHQTNTQQISPHTQDDEDDDEMDEDTDTNQNIDLMQEQLLNFFQGVVSEGKEKITNLKDTVTKNFINSIESENNKTREIDSADPDFMYHYQTPDNFDYGVGVAAASVYGLGKAVTSIGNSVATTAAKGGLSGVDKFAKVESNNISRTALIKAQPNIAANVTANTSVLASAPIATSRATIVANAQPIVTNLTPNISRLANQPIAGTRGATYAGTSGIAVEHKVGATLADIQPGIVKTATDKFIAKIPLGAKVALGAGVIAAVPSEIDIASDWPMTPARQDDESQNDTLPQIATPTQISQTNTITKKPVNSYNPPAQLFEKKIPSK